MHDHMGILVVCKDEIITKLPGPCHIILAVYPMLNRLQLTDLGENNLTACTAAAALLLVLLLLYWLKHLFLRGDMHYL